MGYLTDNQATEPTPDEMRVERIRQQLGELHQLVIDNEESAKVVYHRANMAHPWVEHLHHHLELFTHMHEGMTGEVIGDVVETMIDACEVLYLPVDWNVTVTTALGESATVRYKHRHLMPVWERAVDYGTWGNEYRWRKESFDTPYHSVNELWIEHLHLHLKTVLCGAQGTEPNERYAYAVDFRMALGNLLLPIRGAIEQFENPNDVLPHAPNAGLLEHMLLKGLHVIGDALRGTLR